MNLRTTGEPHPIYVSSLFTAEEENKYFDLLLECNDVFTWCYMEMPRLDPKVEVHHLSIKRGVSPKKTTQWHFHPELVLEIEKEVNKLIG